MADSITFILKTALDIVKDAGDSILRPAFYRLKRDRNALQISTKTTEIDFVTETDKAVQDYIFTRLKSFYPHHRFVGEESDISETLTLPSKTTQNVMSSNQIIVGNTWILDPIDGTSNFIHGFPNFCISLAFFQDTNDDTTHNSSKATSVQLPLIGIIYNPISEDLYWARKGEGTAYCNGFPITVSTRDRIKDSFIAFEHGYDDYSWLTLKLEIMADLFSLRPNGVRSQGSCALNLCSIAKGCMDGYFDFGIHAWDFAAGLIIVKEAGGVFGIDIDGHDTFRGRVVCVASTDALLKQLNEIVRLPTSNMTPDIL